MLQTQSDCPYGIQTVGISSVVLSNGSPQVRGLTFMSDYYKAAVALDPTYYKMVPLRDAIYRKYDFTVALSGPAISGTTPYEILFDTGSWDTCIPYGAINTNNITVLQKNTTDGWGVIAWLVFLRRASSSSLVCSLSVKTSWETGRPALIAMSIGCQYLL